MHWGANIAAAEARLGKVFPVGDRFEGVNPIGRSAVFDTEQEARDFAGGYRGRGF